MFNGGYDTAIESVSSAGRGGWWPLAIGMAASLVAVLGSWVPSYWSDEVATLRASRLSWPELFAFVGHKDAVHASYYSIMKIWLGAFGESELATRSLSALAVGAAAAGVVVLARSLSGPRVGIAAGAVFALLPRTTYMGIETRSFALSATVAVWATVLFVVAARTRSWWSWVFYAALVTAGTYLFLYSVLMLAVHAVVLTRSHPTIPALRSWAIAAGTAVLASLPLLVVSVTQKEQIAWLSDQPVVNVWTILVEPAFDSSWLVAAIALMALIVLVARRRALRARGDNALLSLAVSWAVLPVAILLIADKAIGPLYTARYLSFTVPGLAILLALVFTSTPRHGVTWALIAALALAAFPTYLAQRGPYAKNGGSDLSQIADYIHRHAAPGDAIYLQDTGSVTHRPRQALYAYPQEFDGVGDIAFLEPFTTTGTFSDETVAWPDVGPELVGVDRVWVVMAGASLADASTVLLPLGFEEQLPYETNRSVIALYEKAPPLTADGCRPSCGRRATG